MFRGKWTNGMILLLGLWTWNPESSAAPLQKVEQKQQALPSIDLFGISLDQLSQFGRSKIVDKNKPVLIQFWASWCQRCSSLFADLQTFASKHPNLSYIAVSVDEQRADAAAYLSNHQGPASKEVAFYHDNTQALAKKFAVDTVPTVILVDTQGQILSKKLGHISKADLFALAQATEATH